MITSGTILIEKGTVPQSFRLESQSHAGAWMSVGGSRSTHEIAQELTNAFGFDKQKTVNSALKHVIASARLQKCNCLEIDEVAMHSFWGMPYASISAHSCNIQTGPLFAGAQSGIVQK